MLAGLLLVLAVAARPGTPAVESVARALDVTLELEGVSTSEQREVAAHAGHQLRSLCPDCRPQTIAEDGPCGWARAQRTVLLNAARRGKSAEELVAVYTKVYGPEIIAGPIDRGAALAAAAVPYAAAALALLALVVVMQRRIRARAAATPPPPPALPGDGAAQAILARELDELD
jgi:cytochrome c-type biogenesis protein CcmH/NrfF